MTRSPLFVLAVLCGVSVVFASPAAAGVPCTSYAGLADTDGDGYCAFVGASTAASTGWAGKVDCRDDIATINPGIREVVGDGIDQDCSGADAVFPVADTVAKRYLANSGTKSPLAFIVEYARCTAATGRCTPDDVSGKFLVTNPEVDTFRDIYTGTGKVLEMDGYREVVTLEEASHFNGNASGSGGISKKTAVEIAKKAAEDAVKVERDRADKEREAEDARRAEAEAERAKAMDDLNTRIGEVDLAAGTIFADEVEAREEGDTVLQKDVNAAKSHGPLFEAGLVGSVLVHRSLKETGGGNGEIRGKTIGGGGFELRAGVDAKGYQAAGFGQFSFGSDGQGTGPDTALLVGTDVLFDAGSVELGPWLGYIRTEDHANLLDVTVVESGGLIGVELQGDLAQDSAFRAVPFGRLGTGIGYYGTKGQTRKGPVVVSDYGSLFLAQAGFRFGAGALKD